jgi:hypothetical protein
MAGELETASADDEQIAPQAGKKKGKDNEKNRRKREYSTNDLISGALSGLVSN